MRGRCPRPLDEGSVGNIKPDLCYYTRRRSDKVTILEVNIINNTPQIKIIPAEEHRISHKFISKNALRVLDTLHKGGFDAYLVGGCVRDLLLDHRPKDFDVATNAKPEEIKSLFRNCRLIGRRFRLAHVFFDREIIEVATFRGPQTEEAPMQSQHGILLRDNVYGSFEEDIWRRDFTINALYYHYADNTVVDGCQGVADLNAKIVRLMGDPNTRFREDPVRMLRAVRFAAKLGFTIHPDTEAALAECRHLLAYISPARIFDETLKLFLKGQSLVTFQQLCHYDLFSFLFAQTDHCLKQSPHPFLPPLLSHLFSNTDHRLAEGKTVNPAFLLAALLWYPLQEKVQALVNTGWRESPALEHEMTQVIKQQLTQIAIPRRFTTMMREIWQLQVRLRHKTPKRAQRLLSHPRFRAGYDFLLLRNTAGEDLQALCDYWTARQTSPHSTGKTDPRLHKEDTA